MQRAPPGAAPGAGDAPCHAPPERKVQHDYRQAARLAKRASRSYENPMQAYRCAQCGAWHVGGFFHRPQPMRFVNNNHELRRV